MKDGILVSLKRQENIVKWNSPFSIKMKDEILVSAIKKLKDGIHQSMNPIQPILKRY